MFEIYTFKCSFYQHRHRNQHSHFSCLLGPFIIDNAIIPIIISDIDIHVVSTPVRSFERPIVPIDAELKGIALACQGLFLLFAYDL